MVHQRQHFDFVEDSCIMEFYENVEQGVPKTYNFSVITPHLTSQVLQPMQGLGRLKKSLPTISICGLDPPISDSQPLCIPHHSIHPSIHLRFGLPTHLLPLICNQGQLSIKDLAEFFLECPSGKIPNISKPQIFCMLVCSLRDFIKHPFPVKCFINMSSHLCCEHITLASSN